LVLWPGTLEALSVGEGYIAVQPWDHNQNMLNDEESHYDNIRYTELTALVNNLE
jgi:hypothetical protein